MTEALVREQLGIQIRQARTSRGLKLRSLATKACISPAHLSEVERGKKEASSEILGYICGGMNVPVWWILGATANAMHKSFNEERELVVQ